MPEALKPVQIFVKHVTAQSGMMHPDYARQINMAYWPQRSPEQPFIVSFYFSF